MEAAQTDVYIKGSLVDSEAPSLPQLVYPRVERQGAAV